MAIIEQSNWRVSYLHSDSTPLRLGACEYAGVKVIHTASVPFVFVNYQGDSSGPFTDQLQSSDVQVRNVMFGFDLKATYDFGEDYQYNHIWRFHEDGQFGSTIVVQGPGEEIRGRHLYHLPFRYDLDISGSGGDSLQKRGSSGGFANVAKEGQLSPTHAPDFDWRLIDRATNRQAKLRARPGDGAELWALRYKQSESWASFGSSGEGIPGQPGSVPAIYADGQGVQNTNVVLWYIAHLPSQALPSACGPWFALAGYPAVPPPMPM